MKLPAIFKKGGINLVYQFLWLALFCLYFFHPFPVAAQNLPDKLEFQHLGTGQGLPQNWAWSICQDKEGFMWFGTYDGLYKYDGHSATSYVFNPADPQHSLRSNLVSSVYEDRKGRLWVATWGSGLHQVDKQTGNVRAYPIGPKYPIQWDQLMKIYEDKQGFLWINTPLGVARFDPDKHKYLLYPTPDKRGIGEIQEDAAGNLWSGSYRLNPRTGQYTLYPVLTPLGSQLISPMGFDIDSEGVAWTGTEYGMYYINTRKPEAYTLYNVKEVKGKSIIRIDASGDYVWVGTSEGLLRVNPKTNQVISYQSDPSQPGSLSNNFISAIYWDNRNNLWLSTQNGINRASIESKPFYAYQVIPTPASFHHLENEIFSVVEDLHGTIWVSSAGHGIYKMNPRTHVFSPVTLDPADNQVTKTRSHGWSLVLDPDGQLWVGTSKGLYQMDEATGKFTQYPCAFGVRMLDKDASGKLWVGGVGNTLASFDRVTKKFTYYHSDEKDSTSLITGFLNDLMVSRTGEVWMATTTGVGRLNPFTGRSVRYQPNYRSPAGFINDPHVMALFEDQSGIIWVGTHAGGLNRLDPNTHTFTYFTTSNGLPSNRIMSIIGDDKGKLWLGTGNGLSCFNPETGTFRNFDESDGLPGIEFLERGSVFKSKGKLLFGNKDGLVVFHPDSIPERPPRPPVYITGFKVLEKSKPVPAQPIELTYDENFLSFEFSALHYEAPEKNRYAYQLVGVDKDWVYSGTRHLASYTALGYGSYQFRVKATIDGSTWTEAASPIRIVIHPPPWRTLWAYALYGIAFIGVIYGLLYYTRTREKLKGELMLKSVESRKLQELDKLKSDFFANISHEFRTPLSLILAPLEELMAHAKEQPQQLSLFQTMYRHARRLLELINQLLDLSKLEAGKMQVELKEEDLRQVLTGIVLSFSSLAQGRNIRFSFRYPTGQPLVYIDADKLEKIVSNLLSNAFKFTPQGGTITFSVQIEMAAELQKPTHMKQPSQNSSLTILLVQVEDSGIGIPADKLTTIFDRFYQIDASYKREGEGTGIGLALVKELVELQNGNIQVESTPHVRTCFTVRLPVWVSDQQQEWIGEQPRKSDAQATHHLDHPAEFPDPDEHTLALLPEEAPSVLIVEDHTELRLFIRQSLQASYHILEAANGKEGYRQALESVPDLILSDLMMPVMDGMELCKCLKTDERTSHIPVILLTAKGDNTSKLEGLETGADDYMTKPFGVQELHLRIKNLIEARRKLQQRYSRELTLQPSALSITSADERFLQKLMQVLESSMAESTFGVEELGQQLAMSRMQLFRKIKALTNQSPGDFLRSMRLQRGAELLAKGAGTVAEVAFQVGFNDPSYFTKCFQKQYGKTPTEYIEQTLKAT